MMTAGKALDRDNVAGYNCSYLPIESLRDFDELMYILMCGTGVGFSVERQYINKLPSVPDELHETDTVLTVADSKIGWAKAFKELISLLFAGLVPKWDTSKVRPNGARLKTFGGRASGPQPLEELFHFTINIIRGACGRQLNSLEVHDLVCKIADIVVVGGVRRSALISLSNLSDARMRDAKAGDPRLEPQRALANNSTAYTEKPDSMQFLQEFTSLIRSKSGERGFFNRIASQKQAAKNGRRDATISFGTNPCSEIILRPRQFCNLSEVVVRPTDTMDDLKEKVRLATIVGTLQATLTDFRYLRKQWKDNTEEEALLGVSLTGIMDHPVLSKDVPWDTAAGFGSLEDTLQELKEVAIETNKNYANLLGINVAAAITCVKPSGTVSQLVNSSSGIHTRHDSFYIRRVRGDIKDPLCDFLRDQGVPVEPAIGKEDSTVVFSFPIKAQEDTRTEIGAIEHLELWKVYQDNWCEHKPSVTINYSEEEIMDVGAWLFNHFDEVSGIALLPKDDHVYAQAPEESITEEQYNEMVKDFPELDWEELKKYEKEDNTVGSQELACTGNTCAIPDLN
jgi:ribonucleoside-diphosphate reductase alpha chain